MDSTKARISLPVQSSLGIKCSTLEPLAAAWYSGESERRIWINYQDVKHAENLPEAPFDQSKNIPGITGFVQDCGHWQKIKTQIHLEFTKKQHHDK
jgi:hypothetical protein